MTRLDQIKDRPPHILLYGPPGTGKTALALTLGKGCQVVDLDDGLKTGLTLKDRFLSSRREVDVVQCLETNPKKANAFRRAKAAIFNICNAVMAGKYPFKALVVDSMTSFMDYVMRYVLDNSGRPGTHPQIQDWGASFIETENLLTMVKSLPIVVVFTAHEYSYEVDQATHIKLALPGKSLPGKVCAYFDEVLRTKIVNLEGGKRGFVIQSKGTGSTLARSRCNLPDSTKMDLGLPAILKLMGWDWERNLPCTTTTLPTLPTKKV